MSCITLTPHTLTLAESFPWSISAVMVAMPEPSRWDFSIKRWQESFVEDCHGTINNQHLKRKKDFQDYLLMQIYLVIGLKYFLALN